MLEVRPTSAIALICSAPLKVRFGSLDQVKVLLTVDKIELVELCKKQWKIMASVIMQLLVDYEYFFFGGCTVHNVTYANMKKLVEYADELGALVLLIFNPQ